MVVLADLHVHCSDSHRLEWSNGEPYSPENTPKRLLARSISKGKETRKTTLVAVVSFDDNRAEDILGGIKRACSRDLLYSFTDHEHMVSVNYGRNEHFITGQEIPTDQGHVLIIGAGKAIKSRKLADVLKEAKDLNALIIADHPLAKPGFLGRQACRFVNGNPNLGIGEKNLDKHRDFFDAVEAWNGNFPRALARKTLKLATKYGLPVLASSDSHRVSHALQSYTQFEDLDFSSPEKLNVSIREHLKNHKTREVGRSNGFTEPYRHGFEILKTHLLLKTGLIKRT